MGVGNQDETAFSFEGNWREYAPIAFTNLFFTIITLGIYRFWATTRTRQYLWSNTRFIDEKLTWTGTGKELFIGFLIALVLLIAPLFILQFGLQALILQGYTAVAAILGLLAYVFIFCLLGFARFRALRYRLTRTYWHGIRGGSDNPGYAYSWSYFWKTIVGAFAFGLMIPWSMTNLWNERWNRMSFGPHMFEAGADYSNIFGRFLLFYLAPIGLIIAGSVFAMGALSSGNLDSVAATGFLFALLLYAIIGLCALGFYAAYFREAISKLSLSTIDFEFTARAADWFKFVLITVALVIGTLGIGLIFVQYRTWVFFITHLEAGGEINLADLTQSETAVGTHGEGLLDAFDVGAI